MKMLILLGSMHGKLTQIDLDMIFSDTPKNILGFGHN